MKIKLSNQRVSSDIERLDPMLGGGFLRGGILSEGSQRLSLSYLSQFPINCIKLDRHFIERIGKDKASDSARQTRSAARAAFSSLTATFAPRPSPLVTVPLLNMLWCAFSEHVYV